MPRGAVSVWSGRVVPGGSVSCLELEPAWGTDLQLPSGRNHKTAFVDGSSSPIHLLPPAQLPRVLAGGCAVV